MFISRASARLIGRRYSNPPPIAKGEQSMRFCRGVPKHMNCCLKKPLNFGLGDAQQLRAHVMRITEEEMQYKAGARKSLDLHHRPEAGLKRRAVKEVYSGFSLCRRC